MDWKKEISIETYVKSESDGLQGRTVDRCEIRLPLWVGIENQLQNRPILKEQFINERVVRSDT